MAEVQTAIDISESDGSIKISFNRADMLNNKAPTISAPKGSIAYSVSIDDKLAVAEQTLA